MRYHKLLNCKYQSRLITKTYSRYVLFCSRKKCMFGLTEHNRYCSTYYCRLIKECRFTDLKNVGIRKACKGCLYRYRCITTDYNKFVEY